MASRVILPAPLLLLVLLALPLALPAAWAMLASMPSELAPLEDDGAAAEPEVADAMLGIDVPELEDDSVRDAETATADAVSELEPLLTLLPKLFLPWLRAVTSSRNPAEKATKQMALVTIMFAKDRVELLVSIRIVSGLTRSL